MSGIIDQTARKLLGGFGITFGGKRNIYEIFGYKQDLQGADFRGRYERGHIAKRIIDIYPEACWASPPTISDDEESQDITPWTEQFNEVADGLNLWSVVLKADILAQIYHYSVIYLGYEGETDLAKPANLSAKLAFVRAHGEDQMQVNSYVDTITDPRFGLPETYQLISNNKTTSLKHKKSQPTQIVHHSRVIHIAQRNLDDPVYGIPYLSPIWNLFDNLDKVTGSSGEIWWLNARGGLNLNIDTEVDIDTEGKEELKRQVDEYQHSMTRVIRTQGVDVNPITMQVPDPSNHVSSDLSLICGATGIPLRMLTGSERGELASTQDDNNFHSRIKERRANFCEPLILKPLLERLALAGDIEDLGQDCIIIWPELDVTPEAEEAVIAKDKASAIATFSNAPNAETVMPIRQFVEDVLKMEFREDDVEEIEAIEEAEIEVDDLNPIDDENDKEGSDKDLDAEE